MVCGLRSTLMHPFSSIGNSGESPSSMRLALFLVQVYISIRVSA